MLFFFFILVLHRNHFYKVPRELSFKSLNSCLIKRNVDDDVDDDDNNNDVISENCQIWIGVLRKATQSPRQLNQQNTVRTGATPVSTVTSVYLFIYLFFSLIQVSLAQLFHVLCRQKAKPYLSVFKLAGLRPRRQG